MKHATLIVAAAVAMGSTGSNANPAAPDLGWLAGHWCSEEGDRRDEIAGCAPEDSRLVRAAMIPSPGIER